MIFVFLNCELDEEGGELRRGGRRVDLQPKEFDLLLYLVRHRDHVVSKHELLDTLWPDAVVTESSLTRAISRVQRALDAASGEAIRTHSRRGYRFVAATQEGPPASSPTTRGTGLHEGFVGRRETLERLCAAWNHAVAGEGSVVLLSGELGIGKTRTAEEIAAFARSRGGDVLSAWCDQGGALPSYWPWIQILRSCVRESDPQPAPARVRAGLSALVPEIGSLNRRRRSDENLGPGGIGFDVSDSLAWWLRHAAAERPLLVILDDLHWADEPSLQALSFVGREIRSARVLLIGTYRHDEVQSGHSLLETIGALARSSSNDRIRLLGLSHEEVAAFVAALAGRIPSDAVVADLWDRTRGNPLFLKEIVRLLIDQGRLDTPSCAASDSSGLPLGLRGVVESRLARLSPSCIELLTAAAVIGREFKVGVLHRAAALEYDAVLQFVEEARAAAVVETTIPGEHSYRFSHPLIRETLLENGDRARRRSWHLRIAEALEALYADDLDRVTTELAEHYMAAGSASLSRALHCLQRAAELAVQKGDYSGAASYYQRALAACDEEPTCNATLQTALLLGLAQVRYWASDLLPAVDAAERAAAIARRRKAHEDLARAALTTFVKGPQFGEAYTRVVALLEEAEVATRGMQDESRAQVLARLAHELVYQAGTAARRPLFVPRPTP